MRFCKSVPRFGAGRSGLSGPTLGRTSEVRPTEGPPYATVNLRTDAELGAEGVIAGLESKRQAAIAGAMLMTALEGLAWTA